MLNFFEERDRLVSLVDKEKLATMLLALLDVYFEGNPVTIKEYLEISIGYTELIN